MSTSGQELFQRICFVQQGILCGMSSAESHLGLLDCIVRAAERLWEGELCCLGHRRKGIAMCLLYKIYHRADHFMNGYLNHFAAARNTRTSAALSELGLVILCCRTDKFSRSFLPAAVRLWNLLLPGVLSAGTLSSFKLLWICAYWRLSLIFKTYIDFSLF